MGDFRDGFPKSLESFGVSGILGGDAQVLYHTVFNTRHVGQITDLIVARLKGTGIDEFKLRSFITLGLCFANQSQSKAERTVMEPVSIECGIDEEKVALSICFNLSLNVFLNAEGLPERVEKKTPTDSFESLLSNFDKQSDQLILKFNSESRKTEILSVIGIQGRIEDEFFKSKKPLVVTVLENSQIKQTPKPKEYLELGDIDFPTLLGIAPVENDSASPAGEILLPSSEEESSDEVRLAGSSRDPVQDVRRVSGQRYETQNNEVIRIAGQSESLANNDIVVVTGSKSNSKDENSGEGILSGITSAVKSFVSRMWDSAGHALQNSLPGGTDVAPAEPLEETKSPDTVLPAAEAVSKNATKESETKTSDESTSEVGQIFDRLEKNGFEQAFLDAQREIAELKNSIKDQKTQKLADGLLGNLMKERSKLAQISKEASLAMRQKEIEFRDKLTVLNEDIRNKETLIAKKDTALELSKQQLAQMNKVIDKLKVSTQESASLAQFKHKYQVSQKMLQSSKDEVTQLTKKVEDLRNQLSSAQMARAKSTPSGDLSALQTKYDRVVRQVEEFKKANRQLIEQLSESKRPSSNTSKTSGTDDTKGRLDAAMKLAMTNKKEADSLRARVSSLVQEEAKLKAMIAQLQEQLKNSSKAA